MEGDPMNEKKIEVFPVAIQLFSEKGYQATSVDEIAKESGMSKGSFYKHFQSKEDLLFEIFAMIPEQFRASLERIYRKEYTSRQEKLVDFISSSIENILSNQIHVLLTSLIFEGPIFKNKELLDMGYSIKIEVEMLLKEFFQDLYGDKIKDYIWDLITLQKSLIYQYMFGLRCINREIDINKLAPFIATEIDIMVEGLIARKPESVLSFDMMLNRSDESPLLRGQRNRNLLKNMEQSIKSLKVDAKQLEEYQKALTMLEEQCTKKDSESFLQKALIQYLQEVPELKDDCLELKALLGIG